MSLSDSSDMAIQLVDELLDSLLFFVELYDASENRIDSATLLREEYEYGEAPTWVGSVDNPPVGVVGAVDDPERTYRALSAGAVGMLAAKARGEGTSPLLGEAVRSVGDLLGGLAKIARIPKPLVKSIDEAFAPEDLAEWAQRGGEIAFGLSGGDREIGAFVAAIPGGAGPGSSVVVASPTPRPSAGGVVDINSAARGRLQQIPGVGRAIADRIIAARPFRSIDEVADVPGIGPQTMDAIRLNAAVFDDEQRPDEPLGDGGLVSRPDVITIRFRAAEDGSVTRLIPETGSEFPFDEPYVDNRSQVLAALQQSVVPMHYDAGFQAGIGQQLINALMVSRVPGKSINELSELYNAAESHAAGGPVTLQLAFDEGSFRAAQLPWELVGDKSGHVVADERVRINRYITYFGDREPFDQVDPLRVLYLESRPKDAGSLPDITGAYEEAVERLGTRIQTTLVRHATLADLESALAGGSFHVVHYDGHGAFDGVTGYLLFEDGSRNTDWVTADSLTGVLKDSGVRLVVLGACQGSTVGGMGIFQSTAPALIRAGIPAVVANQFSVYVDAEKAFTNEFYASIARGESISAAVADGRKAMAPYRGHFFLPTLYLRVADGEGYLFGGEPETHRRWRMTEMQKLSAWWWGMSELQRALYREGLVRWRGTEVQPVELPPVRRVTPESPPVQVRETSRPVDPLERGGSVDSSPERATTSADMDLSGEYALCGRWEHPEELNDFPWDGVDPRSQVPEPPGAVARRVIAEHTGTRMTLRSIDEPHVFRYRATVEMTYTADNSSLRFRPEGRAWGFEGAVEYEHLEGEWTERGAEMKRVVVQSRASLDFREADPNLEEYLSRERLLYTESKNSIATTLARGGYRFHDLDLLTPTPLDDPAISVVLSPDGVPRTYVRVARS